MSRIRVTDHAVLRYLERVHGFDVEVVRQHIAHVCVAGLAGAISVRAEGVRFAIGKGPTVVSVTPDSPTPNRTTRERVKATTAR